MTDNAKELLAVVDAAFEYIDTIPKDIQLPAMPGFDRDWAISVIEQARLSARKQASVEEVSGYIHTLRSMTSWQMATVLLAKYDIFEKVSRP